MFILSIHLFWHFSLLFDKQNSEILLNIINSYLRIYICVLNKLFCLVFPLIAKCCSLMAYRTLWYSIYNCAITTYMIHIYRERLYIYISCYYYLRFPFVLCPFILLLEREKLIWMLIDIKINWRKIKRKYHWQNK